MVAQTVDWLLSAAAGCRGSAQFNKTEKYRVSGGSIPLAWLESRPSRGTGPFFPQIHRIDLSCANDALRLDMIEMHWTIDNEADIGHQGLLGRGGYR